jgi:hypothetical protein
MAHRPSWMNELTSYGRYTKIVVHWKSKEGDVFITEEHHIPVPRQTKPNGELYKLTEVVQLLEQSVNKAFGSKRPKKVIPHNDPQIVEPSIYPYSDEERVPRAENAFWFEMWFENVHPRNMFYEDSYREDMFKTFLAALPT